jgi:hypothetical protein
VRGGNFALLGLLIAWQTYGYVFGFFFDIALSLLYAGSHYV